MSDMLFKNGQNRILAGNIDRFANEPNLVMFSPDKKVLLYKPLGVPGANMGVNSHNLVIGYTKTYVWNGGNKVKNVMTGMQMLEAALEKTENAIDAYKLLISLALEHGQGGDSFLIADADETYHLETAGKFYAVKKIEKQTNISNRLRISDDYIESNIPMGKRNHFITKLFLAKEENESRSFRFRFLDPFMSYLSGSKTRGDTVNDALTFTSLEHEFEDILEILKSHNKRSEYKLYTTGSISSVCMHGKHETTGSMVIVIRKSKPSTIWVTGSSTPCLSIYKPVFFGIEEAPVFSDAHDAFMYWRDRELINRAVFSGKINEAEFKKEISEIQKVFIEEEKKLFEKTPTKAELKAFMEKCARTEMLFYNKYFNIKKAMMNDELKLSIWWNKRTKQMKKTFN